MYEWAANKSKLKRSIDFVNKEPQFKDNEKMIKEYYVQIGGLVLDIKEATENVAANENIKDYQESEPVTIKIESEGKKVNRGRPKKNETDNQTGDLAAAK